MKILVVGASGTIGSAVRTALEGQHEVITANRRSGDTIVDLAEPGSIHALFEKAGSLNAIISTAGNSVAAPLDRLTDAEFFNAANVQMLGQANLVRIGCRFLSDGGSVTLTTGPAAHTDFPGASAIAMACAGVERFVRAATTELPDTIRVNAVSPIYVKETMERMGMPSEGGLSAADTARAYLALLNNNMRGQVVSAVDFA
ncbi:short chain dehydrogenase [Roseibium sp. SCP14]|uniref:short chain dehydrogenase n=1 Tax=Roseibium sp. SCP14 TaxID=3141375 RepID=UPI003339CADF